MQSQPSQSSKRVIPEKSCRERKHHSWVSQVLIAITTTSITLAVASGCRPANADRHSPPPASPELIAQGEEAYAMYCAMCHLAGEAGGLNPALIGSPVLAGPPEETIRVILNGQSGVSRVNGKPLGGVMPNQAYLTNQEVAAIVAYVRKEFSKINETVDPAQVQALRKK